MSTAPTAAPNINARFPVEILGNIFRTVANANPENLRDRLTITAVCRHW